MTNGLPMGHRSFRPKWRSVCQTASIRGLARMGDPAAMVIPAADFSRTAERSCAEAISCTNAADPIIEKGKIGKSRRPHGGVRLLFSQIYGVSYAKCALEDCSATIT